MDSNQRFAHAIERLSVADPEGSDLCGPIVTAFRVSGVSIATLGDPLGSETVSASDEPSAHRSEIQIDLSQGPIWSALASRHPVLEADLRREGGGEWPLACEALKSDGVGAVYAFPLSVGSLGLGAVGIYSDTARTFTPIEVTGASALATIVARKIFRRGILRLDLEIDDGESDGPYARREVHQASGIIAAQLGISVADALAVLQAHSFSSGASVRDCAAEVIARRLDLSHPLPDADLG